MDSVEKRLENEEMNAFVVAIFAGFMACLSTYWWPHWFACSFTVAFIGAGMSTVRHAFLASKLLRRLRWDILQPDAITKAESEFENDLVKHRGMVSDEAIILLNECMIVGLWSTSPDDFEFRTGLVIIACFGILGLVALVRADWTHWYAKKTPDTIPHN